MCGMRGVATYIGGVVNFVSKQCQVGSKERMTVNDGEIWVSGKPVGDMVSESKRQRQTLIWVTEMAEIILSYVVRVQNIDTAKNSRFHYIHSLTRVSKLETQNLRINIS